MSEPIRIVIAEDQTLVLGAIAALLALEDDFRIVGQACDGTQAMGMVSMDTQCYELRRHPVLRGVSL